MKRKFANIDDINEALDWLAMTLSQTHGSHQIGDEIVGLVNKELAELELPPVKDKKAIITAIKKTYETNYSRIKHGIWTANNPELFCYDDMIAFINTRQLGLTELQESELHWHLGIYNYLFAKKRCNPLELTELSGLMATLFCLKPQTHGQRVQWISSTFVDRDKERKLILRFMMFRHDWKKAEITVHGHKDDLNPTTFTAI